MNVPSAPALVVSRLDCERLEALLEATSTPGPECAALEAELSRAQILEPAQMPSDVISMNSTARLCVLDGDQRGDERELTLVYPRDADGRADRVSILAPVGSALLGLRIGDSIDWPVPGGRSVRLEVLSIAYQPEAAGELHR